MDNIGVMYVATGSNYVLESINSYKSLCDSNGKLKSVIYTDKDNYDIAKKYFDYVEIMPIIHFNFIDKIYPLLKSPFEKTLFLDSDTYIINSIESTFGILDEYDIAACHAPGNSRFRLNDVPDYFPEVNTGMFFFKKNKITDTIFTEWLNLYQEQINNVDNSPPHDQPAFRKVISKLRPKIFFLPNQYNFRTTGMNYLPVNHEVKVIHGRHKDYLIIKDVLSSDKGLLFIDDYKFLSLSSFKSANLKLNQSIVVRFLFNMIVNYSKVIDKLKLNKNTLYKKKGNMKTD